MRYGGQRRWTAPDRYVPGADFSYDKKFDIQVHQGFHNEEKLARAFTQATFELKTESYLWEKFRNICIEYEWDGRPSGIAATKADFWIHELVRRDGETLIYLMFPMEQLRQLARRAYKAGKYKENGGDKGLSCFVLIPLAWCTQYKF